MKFVFNQVILQCHLKFALFFWFAPQGPEIQTKTFGSAGGTRRNTLYQQTQIPNPQCTVDLHAFDTKTAQNVGQYILPLDCLG